jgi:hypothetical protein
VSWLAIKKLLGSVPRWAWGLLAAVALLGGVWMHGRAAGKEACQRAQEAAEKRADAKGERVAKRAQDAAKRVRDTIRKESDDAQAEVREIVRYLPSTCPSQPDRVRELGDAAVQGARREVLPAEGR